MPSVGEIFQRALIDSAPTPQARLAVISVLARFSGSLIYLPTQSKAARRARVAHNALSNGVSPADVATLLRERYNVSARTALRDVKAAKSLSS